MAHPIMLGYEQTFEKKFPLIMIVGREPNTETMSKTDGSLGGLPFTDKGIDINGKSYNNQRCSFWNIAFGTFARYNQLNIREIKTLFVKKKACPLIFTDASPIAILNSVNNKYEIRKEIDQSILDHVEMIFSKEEIIQRVKHVIFSGLQNPVYNTFKTQFIERANKYAIHINADMPFFYGTHSEGIQKAIKQEDVSIFNSVYKEFINC
ncbi:MAG: hypothetical protein WCP65_01610 [Bacteroidota bacterium]